jgi:hypothetical protein
MFLLPQINLRLRPKILDLKPGTRIVSNTFTMDEWTPDQTATIGGDCSTWCTALFWIVPAKVGGTWRLLQGDLTLRQEFQMLSGSIGSTKIANGRMRGSDISFTSGGARYTGRVNGSSIQGTVTAGSGASWTATKLR